VRIYQAGDGGTGLVRGQDPIAEEEGSTRIFRGAQDIWVITIKRRNMRGPRIQKRIIPHQGGIVRGPFDDDDS
jgi:hypothetical protein